MNEKRGALVRAGEVQEMLGVTDKVVDQMAQAGTIKRIRLYPRGQWFYYRREIEAIAGEGSGDAEGND